MVRDNDQSTDLATVKRSTSGAKDLSDERRFEENSQSARKRTGGGNPTHQFAGRDRFIFA